MTTTLLFGIDVSTSAAPDHDPVAAAQEAERLGYDFVSASDHPCGTHPTFETTTMLTWIAARTSRIAVATRVLGVPFRRPALVAKTAESLDRLSGGRLILGLGAGHSDDEIAAVGGDPLSPKEKIDGLADAVHIIHGAWTQPDLTHSGTAHRATGLVMTPKPAHRIPIWLGTFGPRALDLTGRVADGWVPSLGFAPPERIPAMRRRVLAGAAAAGRAPEDIRCVYNVGIRVDPAAEPRPGLVTGSASAIVDQLDDFLRLGFTGVNCQPVGDDRSEQATMIAEEVLPKLRA